MSAIHITDIEAAINWWRERTPTVPGVPLPEPIEALAQVYALMVYYREVECDEVTMPRKALEAWLGWYDSTPDTPCIAICSTSQGDDICKGCGRTFWEVQHWPELGPTDKRATWRRITMASAAWRFNRYAERAAEKKTAAHQAHQTHEAHEAHEAAAVNSDLPAPAPATGPSGGEQS